MLDSQFRSSYQLIFVDPVLSFFPKIKIISPKVLTVCGCLSGVLVLPFLIFGLKGFSLFSLLLSGYFDTLDGTVARISGRSSPKGAVLDIFCDRIVEFSVILGLYCVAPESRGLLSLLMLGSVLICITSFLTVGVFTENESEKSFHYSPGLIERGEAFILFSLMIIFPSIFSFLALTFSSLVMLTASIRVYEFSRSPI